MAALLGADELMLELAELLGAVAELDEDGLVVDEDVCA
jgi:hypothetical protein